ncbi:hypothetical protein ABZ816_27565 [Actinosynnema sp. NPDC047251]|uniref:Uncharacterized protein n=1 Tax=Saccharothrix espanaensis (strain ATCC 51144 / DSM 44229 / JCM 9112 / NBRC 15066 / NRRL 15764) TaxID=1179773 RepID=K0JX20_SACES|nr:hypothetical protein [Saccharothrix espanaensis]CCH28763.1 hypothetical protein BN6_14400 [Saccharothrix espanaensis DSM 44229]
MSDTNIWVRLHTGWSPRELGWALWQPGYAAHPWPDAELRPSFEFFVCEDLPIGGRGIVARATVTKTVGTMSVSSPQEAYQEIADALFDDVLAIAPEDWRANRYNGHKTASPWPQQLTAWRAETEEIGPYLLPELSSFPRTGWLRLPDTAL